jgi:hypothetical protein
VAARKTSIRAHAELRCTFAHAVAALKALPFGDALRDFTDLHRRATGYRAGESDAADRDWASLIAAIGSLNNRDAMLDCVVDFMAAANLHRYGRSNSPHWPFRYDFHEPDRTVRMHFGSLQFYRVDEMPQPGLLSRERLPELRESLRRMFTEIRSRHPAARQVRGGSWLYNWESYRRLYPAAFTASAEIQRGNFTGGSRWGQFHTGQGEVNTLLAAEFRMRLARLDLDDLEAAFPITTLSVRASIETFYREYGLS